MYGPIVNCNRCCDTSNKSHSEPARSAGVPGIFSIFFFSGQPLFHARTALQRLSIESKISSGSKIPNITILQRYLLPCVIPLALEVCQNGGNINLPVPQVSPHFFFHVAFVLRVFPSPGSYTSPRRTPFFLQGADLKLE